MAAVSEVDAVSQLLPHNNYCFDDACGIISIAPEDPVAWQGCLLLLLVLQLQCTAKLEGGI